MGILQRDFFQDGFFDEEERSGFVVSSEMKHVWAAAMKVFSYVIDVCERYQIQYFADYGTLLGAVRHRGFIPWDDDIDISLKRKDYMRLLSALKKENNPDYQVYSCYFNDNATKVFTSVSNYGSVPLPKEVYDRYFECPYVAGIDIFILDYVPRDEELFKLQESVYTAVYDVANRFDERRESGELEHYLKVVEDMCNVKLVRDDTLRGQLWRLADSVAAMFTDEESDRLVSMSEYISGRPYLIFDKELFADCRYMKFEGMNVAVPMRCEDVLSTEYGDYMEMKQNNAYHNYPYFKNQKEYLEKIGRMYI